MITISFIIPTYNSLSLLQRCLKSLMGQVGEQDEIIIIDDGSTDGTFDYLEGKYLHKPNLICLQQENSGQGKARNLGIETHQKDYIWFIDSDDMLVMDAVAKVKQRLSWRHEELLFFDYYMIGQDQIKRPVDLNIDVKNKESLYLSHHFPWNKVISSKLLEGIRFPEIKVKYEDHGTLPKLITQACKIGYLQEYLYIYDFSLPNNSSKDPKKENDIYVVCNRLRDFYEERNIKSEVNLLIIKPLLFGKILTIPKYEGTFDEKYEEYMRVKAYLDQNMPGWRKSILLNRAYKRKSLKSVEKYPLKNIMAKAFAFSPELMAMALLARQKGGPYGKSSGVNVNL